jgi:hypothetical protein
METVRELAGQLRTLDYDDTIGDVGLDNLVIVTVQERIDRGHKTIKDLWDQAQELKAAAHTMKETAERKELLARFWAARAKSKNKPGELESLLPMAEPATDEALHGGRLPHAEDGPDQGEHCGSVGHDV